MSDDEAPVAFGAETAPFIQVAVESVLETAHGGSAVEPATSSTQDLATPPDAPMQAELTPDPAMDEAIAPQPVRQRASAARDAYVAGRDITVHQYGPDLGDLESVRLFSESQRKEASNSYLQQAVKQAEVTFRMSVWFITAGGLVVIAAVVLGLIRPSTPHSVSYVSGLAGLLIGSGGGAFAIRADKSRKHLSQAMKQVDAEVQEERRFAREAWRYAQATKAISDIRDNSLNDQARMELARMILTASQPPSWRSSETSAPELGHPAIQQGDDTPQARPTGTSRRRRPTS